MLTKYIILHKTPIKPLYSCVCEYKYIQTNKCMDGILNQGSILQNVNPYYCWSSSTIKPFILYNYGTIIICNHTTLKANFVMAPNSTIKSKVFPQLCTQDYELFGLCPRNYQLFRKTTKPNPSSSWVGQKIKYLFRSATSKV
jgi:hypothetical protein